MSSQLHSSRSPGLQFSKSHIHVQPSHGFEKEIKPRKCTRHPSPNISFPAFTTWFSILACGGLQRTQALPSLRHYLAFPSFPNTTVFFKDFIYLFLEREEWREKERERNIDVWLPLTHPQQGTQPAAQACALTGNTTSNPSVLRLALNPLSHTS